jgi:hypothetical protein
VIEAKPSAMMRELDIVQAKAAVLE